MLKHHLLISFRNLKRFKGSFMINLIGLSTGLACTLFIYLWVNDELHFDKFHKNDKQLYQVMEVSKENDELVVHDGTQGLLADAMARDLPEVQSAVPVMSLEKQGMMVSLKTPDKVLRSTGLFAGKDFFNMFSFKLMQGNPGQVLSNKNAIVVSENLATSLFGSPGKAVGKSIEYELFGKKMPVLVSGIFENVPANSSMKFDFVLTHEALLTNVWPNGNKWWNTGPVTYLQLKEGTNVAGFDNKIENFIDKYFKENDFTLFTRPYSSVYLHATYENGIQTGGRIEYVKLFFHHRHFHPGDCLYQLHEPFYCKSFTPFKRSWNKKSRWFYTHCAYHPVFNGGSVHGIFITYSRLHYCCFAAAFVQPNNR